MVFQYRSVIFFSFIVIFASCLTYGQDDRIKLLKPHLGGTQDNPIIVTSPVIVTWEMADSVKDKYMVVQIYNGYDEQPIFPKNNIHKPSKSGVEITLEEGEYELKVWRPGKNINVSTWIMVEEKE